MVVCGMLVYKEETSTGATIPCGRGVGRDWMVDILDMRGEGFDKG